MGAVTGLGLQTKHYMYHKLGRTLVVLVKEALPELEGPGLAAAHECDGVYAHVSEVAVNS